MKKKIFLLLILLLEIAFFVVHGFFDKLGSPEILNFVNVGMDLLNTKVVAPLIELCHLQNVPFNNVIVILAINIAFIIVYYLIFGTITAIRKASKRKRVYRIVKTHYQLTPTEEEKFSYQKYMRKFPKVRVLSLIIPLCVLALLFLARFDKEFGTNLGANLVGSLNIYSTYIQPVFINVLGNDNIVKLVFVNPIGIGYFDLVNLIPVSLYWLDYVIFGLVSLLLLTIWYLVLTLLYLPFRKCRAKRRAKKARNKFIFKKDYQEYKLRIKHGNKVSSKSEEFMSLVESEEIEKQELAKQLKREELVKKETKPMEYYDDLGHGVKDLGVSSQVKEKKDKALIEREVRYISDKDFDIELEEEPVIEIVEEDSIDQIRHQTKEDELFYEKYQPEDLLIKPVEEYAKDRLILSDYVSQISDVHEEELNNEDLVEDTPLVEVKPVEEAPAVEEVIEDVQEETPVVEEEQVEEVLVAEEEELGEDVTEEVVQVEEELVEEAVEETPVIEEEPIEEVVEDKQTEETFVEEETPVVEETLVVEEVEEESVEEETPEVVEISLENLSPLEKYRLQKKLEKEQLEKERQELIESGNLTEENDPLKKYRKAGVRIGKSEVRVPTLKEQEILRQAEKINKKQKKLGK